MQKTIKFNTFIDKLLTADVKYSEVLAFNEFTQEYDWYHETDCVESRHSGTWLVKDPLNTSSSAIN